MYRIAICDDQVSFLDTVAVSIRNYCAKQKREVFLQLYSDSDAMMDLIEAKNLYDIYFLDIDMPCYSGLDLAAKIHGLASQSLIVLLTGYEHYAVQACGMNIFRYVLKTHWEEEHSRLLDDLFLSADRQCASKFYIINNQRRYVKLPQREIVSITKAQKNAVFHLTNGEQETDRISLHRLYDKLDNPSMYYLERGIILNLYHIRSIEHNSVNMDNSTVFYLGTETIRQLKKRICSFWGEYYG